MSSPSVIVLITGNFPPFPLLPSPTPRSSNTTYPSTPGANAGIGYAAVKVLVTASEKYHVILASRSPEKGAAASKEIQAAGIKGAISTITLDVTDEKSIAAATQKIETDHGRLDVLINNAGISGNDESLKRSLEKSFNTNVIGPALMTEAFTPLLLKYPKPYLLHISSAMGSITRAGDPSRFEYGFDAQPYRMSKAALNMMTMQGSKVLGPQGIKVFAVCPGFVVSNIRGTSEEARTVGGAAGDPMVSGQTVLRILEGERDADVGKFLSKDEVYPW